MTVKIIANIVAILIIIGCVVVGVLVSKGTLSFTTILAPKSLVMSVGKRGKTCFLEIFAFAEDESIISFSDIPDDSVGRAALWCK